MVSSQSRIWRQDSEAHGIGNRRSHRRASRRPGSTRGFEPTGSAVNNLSTHPVSQYQPTDGWATRRIWIAGAFGAMLAGSNWILDFWPLGAGGSLGSALRSVLDLSRLLLLLPLAGFVAGLLIAAGIALWRRCFRRMASSLFAIAAMPVCFVVVAKVPLFDPWLWYTMANSTRFEALAANSSPSNGPKYAVIEIRDVSIGFAGIDPNHFVLLIYDESDAVGLDPSERPGIWGTRSINPEGGNKPIPRGRRLYGHFFRVDEFD